jgi:hypothetical protein
MIKILSKITFGPAIIRAVAAIRIEEFNFNDG